MVRNVANERIPLRRTLRALVLLTAAIWVTVGCAPINSKQLSLRDHINYPHWFVASTSTTSHPVEKTQIFSQWYWRVVPGKVEVMACNRTAGGWNLPACTKGFFLDTWFHIDNFANIETRGSHNGHLSWISFSLNRFTTEAYWADELIVCASPLMGEITCTSSTKLPP